jgi:hypothetical protein
VEVAGEDFPDLGQAVEPEEEAGASVAVPETGVEPVAKVVGETGDFSGAGHRDDFLGWGFVMMCWPSLAR